MTGISAEHLTMRFDRFTAVNDVNFAVEPGEFVTLLGPSGCGKTTLLKMISGFLVPTAGTIHLGDQDVTKVPPESRDTALCFQSYALFPHLTVGQNLVFGLKQKKCHARSAFSVSAKSQKNSVLNHSLQNYRTNCPVGSSRGFRWAALW
nr:ABC transporter ATP-binding protein [Marinicella sp. W31]MDC2878238.1 ABC transporter ATP-binding protein [Marinicella sp. W31]